MGRRPVWPGWVSSARPAPFSANARATCTPARQHASTPAHQRPFLALKLADVRVCVTREGLCGRGGGGPPAREGGVVQSAP